VGTIGYAVSRIDTSGKVFVHGEYWNAVSSRPIPQGAKIRVIAINGMIVTVQEESTIAENTP
jgi:membrane-bound serine protease (ClpP class)